MATIVNVYDLLPKRFKVDGYINPNRLMPQHPFRMIIVGASGSGKTNILFNIIELSQNFHKLYVYAKKLDEPIYKYLLETWEKKSQKIKESLIESSNSLDEITSVSNVDESKQNLFIFDDLVTEQNLSTVEELWIRGRKSNTSSIFISQSYFRTPKMIRDNSNYFILTKFLKGNDLSKIAYDQSASMEPDEFKKLYRLATKDQWNFFLIDNKTQNEELHLRRNFNYSLITNRNLTN